MLYDRGVYDAPMLFRHKHSDIPSALQDSLDVRGRDFLDSFNDFLDTQTYFDADCVRALLLCTKGTLRKQLRKLRLLRPGDTLEDVLQWMQYLLSKRNEDDLTQEAFEAVQQGRQPFRAYVERLTEAYDDCTAAGITITPFHFRKHLVGHMSKTRKTLRVELMRMPTFRTMPLEELTEHAEALEESLHEASGIIILGYNGSSGWSGRVRAFSSSYCVRGGAAAAAAEAEAEAEAR
eukprot:SAG11_NODE_993_length_6261_cov_114.016391_3_plen_235_part_00